MKNPLLLLFLLTSSLLSAQDAGTLLFRADSFYSAKKYTEAIPVYTAAIKAGATKGETTYQIGNCYFFLGRDTLAQKNYNEAEAAGYKRQELYFMRGQSKTYMKNNAAAIEDYSKAIAINPKYNAALKNRAYLYQQTAQYTQAVADYNVILQSEQSSPLFYARGYNLQMNTMYDKAILDYQQAIKLDSSKSDIYLNCGNCFLLTRNFTEGIRYYNFAIQKNPSNAIAYYSRGLAFQSNGKNILACEDLKKAQELGNPNAGQFMSNCGSNPAQGTFLYCFKKGTELPDEFQKEKIDLYNQALQIYTKKHDETDSLNLMALYLNRGNAYVKLGDFVNAEKDYNIVLKLHEKNPLPFYGSAAYYQMGDLLVAKKEYQKAISNYDKAIAEAAKSSRVPEYYFNARALAKFYDGDTKGACEDYKSALNSGMQTVPGSPLADLCK